MSNITLKQLRYFDALARTGQFATAAAQCNISQPALSMQVKELESTFGVVLVDRGQKSLPLTPVGQTVWAKAQNILNAVEDLEDVIRSGQGALGGILRLGVIPTIAPYYLPKVMHQLAEDVPDLNIRPREAMTKVLMAEVLDGRLDAALVALPISEPGLAEFPLFSESFVLARSKRDAGCPVPNLERLPELRLLLLEEGHCFRDQALEICKIPGAPEEMMEGSSLSTLVQMVGAGVGITLLPEMAVPIETRAADIDVARFPDPNPQRHIGLIWRKSSPLIEEYQAIGAHLRGQST